MTEDYVILPRHVVTSALHKARAEYVRVAERYHQDPGPEHECWAEFEALADWLDDPEEVPRD